MTIALSTLRLQFFSHSADANACSAGSAHKPCGYYIIIADSCEAMVGFERPSTQATKRDIFPF
jgi:hypothetical protein